MKGFAVGVFEHLGKRTTRLEAYTRYYLASWQGCCEHVVMARNGTEAKQIAKREHAETCMRQPVGVTGSGGRE